jgi:hypothetical protein
MLIGISGKSQSGKDECGKIIQYLTSDTTMRYDRWLECYNNLNARTSNWQIVKFANALKDIVCILTGCTRKQLEDIDFKNSKLDDEWIRYGYADGFSKKYIGNGDMGQPIMNFKECDEERYEIEFRTNWQTAYKDHLTYRQLLQYLGTDLLRNQLHENVWINALFSKYKYIQYYQGKSVDNKGIYDVSEADELLAEIKPIYPNWIITDTRFENEAKAVKNRGGIVIRVNSNFIDSKREITRVEFDNEHSSETALDLYKFDYVIDNNSSIEDLIVKVKDVLIKAKII